MEKIFIGDDNRKSGNDDDLYNPPVDIDDLRSKLQRMNVFADVMDQGSRVKVVVQDHVGTAMYLSSAAVDNSWLTTNAFKKQKIGSASIYYFKF
jgi:hypothetical protein